MLEQPFPANLRALSSEEIENWKDVKKACTEAGVVIYADESCSVADDVSLLTTVAHGVNIKLEKCGM